MRATDERAAAVRRWMRGTAVLALVLEVVVLAATPVRADSGAGPGGWTWPVGAGSGSVSRAFAPPETRYGAGHRGVDLASSPGAVVVAAGAGEVAYAGLLAGRGVVVVRHGDLRTTYEPVTAEIAVGARVAAGTPLGRLDAGHASCPSAACLHWGLRRGEAYLDPLSLVGAGPVRLLPLGAEADPYAGGAAGAPATGRDGALPEPPQPAPGLDLRAAATPSGVLALVALLAGLALLVRRGPPRQPAGGAAVVGRPGAAPAEVDDRPAAPVVDLARERLRRAVGG